MTVKLLHLLYIILVFIISMVSDYWKQSGRRPSARGIPKEQGARNLEGKVSKVEDGDTLKVVQDNNQSITCRLYGIDAPEVPQRRKIGQPYGKEAARELSKLISGKVIKVETTGEKTYNREVCHVYLEEEDKKLDVNLEMVKRGYAWAYREYLKGVYMSEYIDAEKEARDKEKGLWKQTNPQPPWDYRHSVKFRS
jgi:endonuclease YncB( thermonuclease family)